MRINEYNSLEEFTSQYTGVWGPSDGHWLGLDFSYAGEEYRLQTGSMYSASDTIFSDGRVAVFGLYKRNAANNRIRGDIGNEYALLSEFADMQDLLESKVIHNIPFREIIMDDTTELLGQD